MSVCVCGGGNVGDTIYLIKPGIWNFDVKDAVSILRFSQVSFPSTAENGAWFSA